MQPQKDKTKYWGIGNGVFKKGTNRRQWQSSLNETLVKKLFCQKWILNRFPLQDQQGKWNTLNCSQVFSKMIQARCTLLQLGFNNNPTIIKQICHIRFPYLTQLRLYKNNLQTIQALQGMYFSNLQILSFGDNNITNIQALNKIYCPNLSWLRIDDNKIYSTQILNQIYMPKIKILVIDHEEDKARQQDITWMFKMQSGYMPQMILRSKHRIKRQKINNLINEKFEKPRQHPQNNVQMIYQNNQQNQPIMQNNQNRVNLNVEDQNSDSEDQLNG